MVGWIRLNRPPHNYFDEALIRGIAESCDSFRAEASCRAIVLASRGKAFCAGGLFSAEASRPTERTGDVSQLYEYARRVYACPIPIVAAIQGPATGGGFGLALVADFRVACPEARFWANFVKLGVHPGFGISHTLPALIGGQKAARLLLTGRRLGGEEAFQWGIVDELVSREELDDAAQRFAEEIAANAPLALVSVKETLRMGGVLAFGEIVKREWLEQRRLFGTEDHREGVRAVSERRGAVFRGR